ncbi:hypothetical protein TNCV_3660871 [Trichonephila clavipes]|nr:hypothetical protein TNCV_3660871 [Trichonephila clavipes]
MQLKATRGLLATELMRLGQVTRKISVSGHLITLTSTLHHNRSLGLERFNRHQLLYTVGLQWCYESNSNEGLVHQKEPVNSLKNQSHVVLCSDLRRSCNVEYACSGNNPGTTIEWHARYNPQLHTLSGQKTFRSTVVLQQGFKITTSGRLLSLKETLHEILDILEEGKIR